MLQDELKRTGKRKQTERKKTELDWEVEQLRKAFFQPKKSENSFPDFLRFVFCKKENNNSYIKAYK